jgi:hypothetical protein
LTATAAKRRARELMGAALAGGFDPHRAAPRRLGEALDEYEKWAAVNRPRTARDRRSLARVLRAGLPDLRIDELTAFHVERFKRDPGSPLGARHRRDQGAAGTLLAGDGAAVHAHHHGHAARGGR